MTNKLLELVEEGLIDKDQIIKSLLTYISEDDVKDFAWREYQIEQLESDNETDD